MAREKHNIGRRRVRLAIVGPCLHHVAPLLQCVAAAISGFHLVSDGVRQRRLAKLPAERADLASPVAERRPESVRRDV